MRALVALLLIAFVAALVYAEPDPQPEGDHR
jgi:hypothetical protein